MLKLMSRLFGNSRMRQTRLSRARPSRRLCLEFLEDRCVPSTLLVDPELAPKPGIFATISGAVAAAHNGDTINVVPGLYHEGVDIAKSLVARSGGTALFPEAVPLKFDEKLVLNQWMLRLFDKKSFEQLAEPFKSADLEGLNEDNNHRLLAVFKEHLFGLEEFPGDVLLGYDQNIVKHTLKLNEHRAEPIRWKYFQWLSLLFTEVYLDRFFRNPGKMLADLNAFVEKFNADKLDKDKIPAYELPDLRKIAFWNATGSGKTLLMHVNILQYQHYLALLGQGRELNRIIPLTPNEGLSRQHLVEFHTAGLDADLFAKDGKSLFAGKTIEIIDIHKLREDMGEKTVAIDAFEGKNLVLVDEGHRGSSGKEMGRWMDARRRLCEQGFSFEYSATFGQAMKASSNKALEQEYAKCILFDYSYKYFYRDGSARIIAS